MNEKNDKRKMKKSQIKSKESNGKKKSKILLSLIYINNSLLYNYILRFFDISK